MGSVCTLRQKIGMLIWSTTCVWSIKYLFWGNQSSIREYRIAAASYDQTPQYSLDSLPHAYNLVPGEHLIAP